MRFNTASMLSFTFRNGSRILQRSLWPHSPRTVTQEVMNRGPSIAWITSNAEIVCAGRSRCLPPVVAVWRQQKAGLGQPLQNFRQGLGGNAISIRYVFGAA